MRRIGFVAATLWLGGCAGQTFDLGDSGAPTPDQGRFPTSDQGGPVGPRRPTCPGQASTITGTVFVPSRKPELFPPNVKCEACGSLGTAYNFWTATTRWNGAFTLSGVCPGKRTLIFQNGRFRRMIQVNLPARTTYKVPPDQSRLPRQNGEFGNPGNAIPKIAVATGDYDKMECVLLKMGLPRGKFDLYEGARLLKSTPARPLFSGLVRDLARLKTYNILFINCTDNTFETELKNSKVVKNLADYVSAGGRLYVTDWSYDWIEQVTTLSKYIDFEPGPSGDAPEPMNKAALGQKGLKVQADIKDKGLMQWLTLFHGAVHNGKALVQHFLARWVIINRVHKDAKVWVDGVIRSRKGDIQGRRPLTVTFNFKSCGKVLYSSYHTEGRDDELKGYPYVAAKPFPQYCGQSMSPQDRILEYLIFDIANCIKPIK